MTRFNFKTVTAAACINLAGEVVAAKLYDRSVDVQKFVDYLKYLRRCAPLGKLYLTLDNLPVHHSIVVGQLASQLDI